MSARGPRSLDDVIDRLQGPCRVVVLTGAGMSAPSGLPVYRGTGGMYTAGEVIPLNSADAIPERIEALWIRFAPMIEALRDVQPNAAHAALESLRVRRPDLDITVITQNIDGLHQAAHTPAVELHGSLRRARCLDYRCGNVVAVDDLAISVTNTGAPRCNECGSFLRPDVVLFGEGLDPRNKRAAWAASEDAQVVIAAGTSLQVSPAASYILDPVWRGTPGLWFDIDPVTMLPQVGEGYVDAAADLTMIPGDIAITLPELFAQL